MSPKKINKEEKRKEIAMSCFDLIHEVGMQNLTISEVAKTAGIGKGTIYEYFENKEDIIFEIANIHVEYHRAKFLENLEKLDNTKDRLTLFFDFVLNDSKENTKHFNGYKEFLAAILTKDKSCMKEFNCNKSKLAKEDLIQILNEGINKGELKKEVLGLVDGILTYQKGLIIRKMTQLNFDAKEDFKSFFKVLLKLLEVRNNDS